VPKEVLYALRRREIINGVGWSLDFDYGRAFSDPFADFSAILDGERSPENIAEDGRGNVGTIHPCRSAGIKHGRIGIGREQRKGEQNR
jgi:hypothetical protein